MTQNKEWFFHRSRKHRRGQVVLFTTLFVPVMFGMAALTIDFGLVYAYNSELTASTQAATLAGAYAMSQPGATLTSTTNAVTTYGGTTGNKNAYGNLPGLSLVAGYPKLSCLNTLTSVFGLQCWGPSSSNALVVQQQATAPLFFLRVFGFSSVTLTSTATAAMRGASAGPFNVVIIVDSTRSMTDTDSDSTCSNTRIYCALQGVQLLLHNLAPCSPTEASCGAASAGNVANSVDRVGLWTFPAATTATAGDDYTCGGTPTTAAYAASFPDTSTYQIVNFSSDYRISDGATSLSSSSNIVAAAGGKTGCSGLQAIGGFGTYYAQVITMAQAALVTEQRSYPTSQNVIILLSDGDATATSTDMPGASKTSGLYMSSVQECHQAITAAQTAAAAGTRVYAVAYGAEASGCTTDTSPAITPCQTMQQIASSPAYFFSDYTATGGSSSCISAAQPITSLGQIFQAIATDLTNAKLIPNNTT